MSPCLWRQILSALMCVCGFWRQILVSPLLRLVRNIYFSKVVDSFFHNHQLNLSSLRSKQASFNLYIVCEKIRGDIHPLENCYTDFQFHQGATLEVFKFQKHSLPMSMVLFILFYAFKAAKFLDARIFDF